MRAAAADREVPDEGIVYGDLSGSEQLAGYLILTVAYAGCGILCSILQGREIQDVLIPVGIGVLFLASGFASRGAIGVGDGCILLALGTLLDTEIYIQMLCIGFFLAAFWSGILLVIRKKSRDTEIPLMPFLLAGYIGGVLI